MWAAPPCALCLAGLGAGARPELPSCRWGKVAAPRQDWDPPPSTESLPGSGWGPSGSRELEWENPISTSTEGDYHTIFISIFKGGEVLRRKELRLVPGKPPAQSVGAHAAACPPFPVPWRPKTSMFLHSLPARASPAASCSLDVTGAPWQLDLARAMAQPSQSFGSLGQLFLSSRRQLRSLPIWPAQGQSPLCSRLCHAEHANQMQDNYLLLFDTRGTSRT